MASVIAGCAAPQFGTRSASNFGGKIDKANIGVATRAIPPTSCFHFDSSATSCFLPAALSR